MLPESFLACLVALEGCFTSPSYRRFITLMTGWVLHIGKHTVTGVMRAAGVVGRDEHSGYHRFFSAARWEPDEVGLVLMRLVLASLKATGRVTLSLDDTLARHTGKHIASAGMHRDPLLSTASKPFWHFGHNWVVIAVVVELPRWHKVYSLPVLMRLYRSEKVNQQLGITHKKRTELASEMLEQIAQAFPRRRFLVVADNAYVNRTLVRPLPKRIELIGRGRLDAALHAPANPRRGRGRPAIRGRALRSPEQRAKRGRWTTLQVRIHHRVVHLEVQTFDALWYRVGRERMMRFVLVRGWPGHSKFDVFASTDLHLDAAAVLQLYCLRWSIEETFGWVKSKLGFEDPHNRTERAVQRTAPMALWAYSLVVLWYARWSEGRVHLPMRQAPWYDRKTIPSFADMLATLRRQSWSLWFSDLPHPTRFDQKSSPPWLDLVSYG